MTSIMQRVGTLMIRPGTTFTVATAGFKAAKAEYQRVAQLPDDWTPRDGSSLDRAHEKLLSAVAEVARHVSDDPAIVRAKMDMAESLMASAVALDQPDLDGFADVIFASLIDLPPPQFPGMEPVRRLLIPGASYSEWAYKFWENQPDERRAKYWEQGVCHVVVETRREAMDRCRVAAFVCGNKILRTTHRWKPAPHPDHLSACAWVNAVLVAPAATFLRVIEDRRQNPKFLRAIEQADFDGEPQDVADMARALLMLGDKDWLRNIKRDYPCLWPRTDREVWPEPTRGGRDGSISLSSIGA